MMAPVSVCHQVSTTGHRPPPMWVGVPHPGLRVDGLAHRAEHPERGQVVALGVLGAPLHERADGRGGAVEDGHPVALDDRPPAVTVGEVRRALVHHRGGPVGQRPVDDVAVTGHPADVGRAPVDVALGMEVEDGPVGEGHLGQVAAGGVHDALGGGRGARGVEDEQQVLGVHVLGRAVVGRRPPAAGSSPLISSCHQWSRPSVMAGVALVVGAGPAGHHHVLDARRLRARRHRRWP